MLCIGRSPCISTHAPAGGATRTAPVIHPAQKISTHAPAGGATGLDASIEAAPVISTHAPAGGATQGIRRDSPRLVFLLTPLREGRHRCLDFHHRRRNISTHAPAGGATASKTCTVSCVFVFLLTPLREGRLHGKTMNDLMASFLLTPLREGRLSARGEFLRRRAHFYSRPCGRGDDGDRDHGGIPADDFYSRPCGRGDSNFPQVRHEVLRQIAER